MLKKKKKELKTGERFSLKKELALVPGYLILVTWVGFTAVILLCALLTPGGVQEVGAMIGIAGAAVLGGLVAAVVGGGGKKKRRSRRT